VVEQRFKLAQNHLQQGFESNAICVAIAFSIAPDLGYDSYNKTIHGKGTHFFHCLCRFHCSAIFFRCRYGCHFLGQSKTPLPLLVLGKAKGKENPVALFFKSSVWRKYIFSAQKPQNASFFKK